MIPRKTARTLPGRCATINRERIFYRSPLYYPPLGSVVIAIRQSKPDHPSGQLQVMADPFHFPTHSLTLGFVQLPPHRTSHPPPGVAEGAEPPTPERENGRPQDLGPSCPGGESTSHIRSPASEQKTPSARHQEFINA